MSTGNRVGDVWRSTDEGATWALVNASPGWTARYNTASVALPDGSIVLMGGNDGNGQSAAVKHDVWRSTDDGSTWTEMNPDAPWTPRMSASSVATSDGGIVLMGGVDYLGVYQNDTWLSMDNGATWTEMNASAAWAGRDLASSEAMPDGSIILMAGLYPNSSSYPVYLNDVWRSTDNGATWTEVNASAGWTARYYQSSVALPDGTVVLMGGVDSNGYDDFKDDVWSFTTAGSSAQNPSHTYTSPGAYNVSLQAYNTDGFSSVQKAGSVMVYGPPPVAGFSATPRSGTAPLQVTFTDQSSGSPSGWAWFFGDERYTGPWMQVNTSPGWSERREHSSVVMPDGTIVLMGGYSDVDGYRNDTWQSTDDGVTWTLVNASSGWAPRSAHSSVVMPDDSIVLMGGETGSGSVNDTWRSTDEGATWTQVNASPGWSARRQLSSVAMPDGSIVLMGGYSDVDGYRNDVWRSDDDGATWTEVNASPGWSPRHLQSSVVMPDSNILLMGGEHYGWLNDTYRSDDDGATWTLLNASPGWTVRCAFDTVVMPDGSIILMGGVNDYGHLSDVWRSTDNGVSWTEVTAGAGWGPRSYQSSVVMPDGSIVLTGGFDGYYKNDVWRLTAAGSTDQNPSHTYTASGTYNVTLQAYNAGGYNSTQKAEYIAVSAAPLSASFTTTLISGTAPLVVQFNDTSTGSPTSWNWSFGDGKWFNTTDAASSNVTHVYWNVGSPAAYLLVTNSGGGSTSSSQTITVSPAFTGPAAMYRGYPNRNGTYLNGGITPTGTLKWVNASSNATIGGMRSSPVVADGVVYIGSNDGNITAWNATTGVMLWNFTTSNAVWSSPAVANGTVYVSSAAWSPTPNLYALDAATGKEVWNYSIFGEGSSPAVVDGVLYITELGGNVYALNAANGETALDRCDLSHGDGGKPGSGKRIGQRYGLYDRGFVQPRCHDGLCVESKRWHPAVAAYV